MEKGNVLVLGNAGVGKTTLINAVLGEKLGETGFGSQGTTKELKIYETDALPFRLIDSVGFEPTFFKRQQAVESVRKWTREGINDSKQRIDEVWFCIDGTAGKLFPNAIKNVAQAIKRWPSIPIIVVITKSFSEPDRSENIRMVNQAFADQNMTQRVKAVIPVVASIFRLNDEFYAAPYGITNLIDVTMNVMPEAIESSHKNVEDFKRYNRRVLAHSIVAAATAAGATVGAIPIPIPDSVILSGTEAAEVASIAKLYDIGNDAVAGEFKKTIVEMGTAGLLAKQVADVVKAIPGLNLAAASVNAVIAGIVVAAIGEISIRAYEQVYTGAKTLDDIDWLKKLGDDYFGNKTLMSTISNILMTISSGASPKAIANVIMRFFAA